MLKTLLLPISHLFSYCLNDKAKIADKGGKQLFIIVIIKMNLI